MIIAGVQKLSLLDYPGRTAATVFLNGCSFRCPYCHNGELVEPERFFGDTVFPGAWTETELLHFLERRRSLLDGVCISGGEPLLHSELPQLLRRIRTLGYAIKLDTNGAETERLQELAEEGLVDLIAMDLKNAPAWYQETCGCTEKMLEGVCRSTEYLMKGRIPYEFRTTCVRPFHTLERIRALGEWISGAACCYLQNYTERETVLCPEGLSSFSRREMEQFLTELRRWVPTAELRGML